jgi:zinc protease
MDRSRISPIILAAIAAVSLPVCGQANPAATAPVKKAAPARPAAKQVEKQDLAAGDLRAIPRPALPEFRPQQPKRVQLENGMVIFLQEDHELPLIEASLTIRGGSKSEPADKVGLAGIYGSSWRTGGSKSKTGDELDDLLEARAAKLETSGSSLATFMTLSSLKGDFDFVLDLANDLLHNPEFRQDKIDLAKDQVRTRIARRNDNLGQIASREATKIGYGAQSPYARVAEYDTIAAITRQDLLAWHAKYVQPNNIIFTVVGDFDSATMEARLRKLFADWPRGPATPAPEVAVTPPHAGVYFVEKDDVNQSEVRMIAAGIRRDDPDYYAVEVMNQVLSGGFASRLFSNLRTKAGLAYAVGGSVFANFDHPGLTILTIGTKSGTTARAVEGLYTEIEGMVTRPVTADELQRAKDAIKNSFVFEYDSKAKVMNARATYEFHGYPADFLERYEKGVAKVTAEDVDRVAKKYLEKNKFAVLVVGKAADFDKPLSTFGAVTALDITIPQPGAANSAAPVAGNPEGKALLAKVIEGAGGGAKLKAIKTVHTKATQTMKAQGMTVEIDETILGEDNIHLKVNTPTGELTMIATSKRGFMSMAAMGGTRDMPASQRENMLKNLHRELWSIAQHSEDPQYAFAAQGKEKIGDLEASVLDISAGGDQLRWFVDSKTGRVLRASFQANTPSGPATQVVDYSDWKTVDGVTLPFHREVTSNGQASISVAVNSLEFNPAVDAKMFDRPQP